MVNGYFSVLLSEKEIAFMGYLTERVRKNSRQIPGKTRLQKIAVDIVLQKRLPLTLLAFHYGVVLRGDVCIHAGYDQKIAIPMLEHEFGTPIEDLNSIIDKSSQKYSEELSTKDIRKIQYDDIQDDLYVAKLELERFEKESLLIEKDVFLKNLSKFILAVPSEYEYKNFKENLIEFALISTTLLQYSESPKDQERASWDSFTLLFDWLDFLNAKHRKVKGFEKHFNSSTNPQFNKEVVRSIENAANTARHSIFGLKEYEKSHIQKDPITPVLSENQEKLYREITKILKGDE